MSALADQLVSKNFALPRHENAFFMMALDYLKKGVSLKRAHEILDQAYARLNPVEGKTDFPLSERTDYVVSSPSPLASGKDQRLSAPLRPNSAVPPARSLNLYGPEARAVQELAAKAVFDRYKTNDGRAWGDVVAYELDSLSRDGAFAKALKNKLGTLSNAQRSMTIRQLISSQKFEEARSEANAA